MQRQRRREDVEAGAEVGRGGRHPDEPPPLGHGAASYGFHLIEQPTGSVRGRAGGSPREDGVERLAQPGRLLAGIHVVGVRRPLVAHPRARESST